MTGPVPVATAGGSGKPPLPRRRDCHATLGMTKRDVKIPARASSVPTIICQSEEHSDVAISMRLNTRRRTAVATATRLPRYARNDTVGTLAMTKWVRMSGPDTTTVAAITSWVIACAGSTVSRRLWEGLQRRRGCTTNKKGRVVSPAPSLLPATLLPTNNRCGVSQELRRSDGRCRSRWLHTSTGLRLHCSRGVRSGRLRCARQPAGLNRLPPACG